MGKWVGKAEDESGEDTLRELRGERPLKDIVKEALHMVWGLGYSLADVLSQLEDDGIPLQQRQKIIGLWPALEHSYAEYDELLERTAQEFTRDQKY